ncbi:MAG: hypothetical protein J5590_07290 [Clostridia bacterium]|nr:hypothetical protein [Clostridia bacterium]
MKKVLSVFVVVLVLASSVTCFAQVVNDKDLGVSFALSDNWVQQNSGARYVFINPNNKDENEGIILSYAEAPLFVSIDQIPEEDIKSICESGSSDSELADSFTEYYGAKRTVKADYINTSYETYNGVKYYKYEKVYTVSGGGIPDLQGHYVLMVTAKNGKVYLISHARDNQTNSYSDFIDMLNSISYEPGEIKININGERIYPDNSPVIIEGRTLVPIRAVAEKMGYNVSWDGNTQIVSMTNPYNGTNILVQIGLGYALKDYSQEITLDVPALILADRTYLPLRAVAEAMDATVNWDGSTRTVIISK